MTEKNIHNMTIKDYFLTTAKGILLGLVSLGIPGLSSSTIAIIVGVYFLMVDAISGILKTPKQSIIYLLFLSTGYAIGAVGAAFAVSTLFKAFPLAVTAIICLVLIGCLPDQVIKVKSGLKKVSCWICFIVVVAALILFNLFLGIGSTADAFPTDPTVIELIEFFLIGMVTSATFVVPGVDFAAVFLSLGIYYPFMSMIVDLFSFGSADYLSYFGGYALILIIYCIGYMLGTFFITNLIKLLLKKFEPQVKFAALGFVAASPFIVIKSGLLDNESFVYNTTELIWGLVIGILAMAIILLVTLLSSKKISDEMVDHSSEEKKPENKNINLRFVNLFLLHLPRILYYDIKLKKMKKSEKLTHEEKCLYCIENIDIVLKGMKVDCQAFGRENLPSDVKGCLLVGNHQGKSDVPVVLYGVKSLPVTFLSDVSVTKTPVFRQICDCMDCAKIDLKNLKSQIRTYKLMADNIINKDYRYIVFPEAGYVDNHNNLRTFHSPCFQPAYKAQCPILPFVLYDTWRIIGDKTIRKIHCEIHFLKPIPYEEYKDMTREELAEYVKGKINDKLTELKLRDGEPVSEETVENAEPQVQQ